MLEQKIDEAIIQIRTTGWTIMGGMMPGPIQTKHISAVMLHFALQRTCGWVVPTATIQAVLDGRR